MSLTIRALSTPVLGLAESTGSGPRAQHEALYTSDTPEIVQGKASLSTRAVLWNFSEGEIDSPAVKAGEGKH